MLRRCLLLVLAFAAPLPLHAADAPPSIPKVWNGELMESDQGAIAIHSVIFDMDAGAVDGAFSFLLKGRTNKIVYSFQSPTQNPKAPPAMIWKIKDDVYDLMEVSLINRRGQRLVLKGPYKKAFTVKAGSLSILGEWFLVQAKDGKELRLLVKAQPNRTPVERLQKTFRSVISGLDGDVLQQFDKKNPAAAPGQIRAAIRSQRSILMTYKLDLFQDNRVAGQVAAVLSTNDADIRSCYTDLLETTDAISGTLAYTFVYSGSVQGIKALKIKNSGIKDPRFLECMSYKLRGLTFPIAKSMIGELTFQFQVSE